MSQQRSPNLDVAYLLEGQAGRLDKFNDFVTRVDALAQLTVLSQSLAFAPLAPAEGQRWIVAAQPADMLPDPWRGRAGQIAAYYGGWRFLTPQTGWICWVQDETAPFHWDGEKWKRALGGAVRVDELLDVEAPAPADRDVLQYDGAAAQYVSGPLRLTLGELEDVVADAPADKQVIQYDAGTAKFVAGPIKLGITDLDRVDLPTDAVVPPGGAIPIYEANRFRWRVRNIGLGDLAGISGVGSELDGYCLMWKATGGPGVNLTWKPMPLYTGTLKDWTTIGLANGHVMRWNAAEGKWSNSEYTLRSLGGVTIPADPATVPSKSFFAWDYQAATWKPRRIEAADITAPVGSAPADGSMIKWNATTGVAEWGVGGGSSGGGSSGGTSGGGVVLSPPLLSAFTSGWTDKGISVAFDEANGLLVDFEAETSGSNRIRGLWMPCPAAPYTLVCCYESATFDISWFGYGPAWMSTATGRFQHLSRGAWSYNSQYQTIVQELVWSNSAAVAEVPVTQVFSPTRTWVRLRDDGTNRYIDISRDGATWMGLRSLARAANLNAVPDRIGFAASCILTSGQGAMRPRVKLLHWVLS